MTKPGSPNVLLIVTDHWPGYLLGSAGHNVIKTPGLDELASVGTRFTNCYSECPVCIPARRTLMTGQTPRQHGDRVFSTQMPMPDEITLAQAFRDAGYQADAVGKLHVYPQRNRIGFDSVVLDEEGRRNLGGLDDYDIFLGDNGLAGRQYDHGMSTNQYSWAPWHLDDQYHVTNWASRQMARTIKRRDPTRPSFWYLGFRHPHPPLVPLQSYMDLYRDIEIDAPRKGNWVEYNKKKGLYPFDLMSGRTNLLTDQDIIEARRAFYALCTHIDHQIRWLIGTLQQERILDDTIIVFTSDHGDMLGNHGTVAKRLFYEESANVPLIIVGTDKTPKINNKNVDNRLTGLRDIMPTLLDMSGVAVPKSVEGISLRSEKTRDYIYGEYGENSDASRMVRNNTHKLIYYPVGNCFQLFDLENDPHELNNVFEDLEHRYVRDSLMSLLRNSVYGSDHLWLKGDDFIGLPNQSYQWKGSRSFYLQRGEGWPT